VKALVYTGTQTSSIEDVDAPEPLAGQALIKLSLCGICGSDMHAWHGQDDRRIPPLILGHESVGFAVTGTLAGSRVALNPLMTCNECDCCQNGIEHLCAKRELIGMRVPGAFAEQIAIDEKNLVVLPDHLSFEEAALAEPLACCVHAVKLAIKLSGGRKDPDILILGGGAIGLLSAFVFEAYGYANIAVAETNAVRRGMLKQFEVITAVNPIKSEGLTAQGPDMIIDAVGSSQTRRYSSQIIRPGGVIVHIGLQDNDSGLDTRRITLQEVTFQGTYCYQTTDFKESIDLLGSGKISGLGWVEFRDLADGPKAFFDIHNGSAPAKIILKTQ